MNMDEVFRQIDEAFAKERAEQEQMIANIIKEDENGKEEKEN